MKSIPLAKFRFLCKIFPHDFNKHWSERYHCDMGYVGDWNCRRCGIHISKVYKMSGDWVERKWTRQERTKK